jgi:hypothetical protein
MQAMRKPVLFIASNLELLAGSRQIRCWREDKQSGQGSPRSLHYPWGGGRGLPERELKHTAAMSADTTTETKTTSLRVDRLRDAMKKPEYREKKRQEWTDENRQKQRERMTGKALTVEVRAKQSASLKKAWVERKKISISPKDKEKARAHGIKLQALNKEKMASGFKMALEDGKMKWSEYRRNMDGFRPDEGHLRAKVWRLRSAKNIVYGPFKNLAFFIRNNRHLFLAEDTLEPIIRSHAYNGICKLNPNTKTKIIPGSWKGWTWNSQLEQLQNKGGDLLDRELLD